MSQSITDHRIHSTNMIQSMCAALHNLEYIQESEQTSEYKDICTKIRQFIECNCVNKIVYDSIDTGPDSSKTIKYCVYCEKTFD